MFVEDAFYKVNPNNLGGRQDQAGRMFNHHKALLVAKPSFNSRVQPHAHVDANRKSKKPPLYKQLYQFGNVYRTFRAIAQTDKGKVDTDKPETIGLRHMNMDLKKPKLRSTKQNDFIAEEHQRRLLHQERRKEDYSTWKERLKRNCDPVAHPVVLYRHENEKKDANKTLLSTILPDKAKKVVPGTSKTAVKRAQSAKRPGSAYVKEGGGENYAQKLTDLDGKLHDQQPLRPVFDHTARENALQRPRTAQDLRREQESLKQQFEQQDFVNELPVTKEDREQDYQYIKVELIKLIIRYRIFRIDDLEALFGRTLIHNKHMDIDKLEGIFKELKEELEA